MKGYDMMMRVRNVYFHSYEYDMQAGTKNITKERMCAYLTNLRAYLVRTKYFFRIIL